MQNDMIDIVFDLRGSMVPPGYRFDLWDEIVRALPWLEDESRAGILPLKGAASRDGMLLPQRAKLTLRLPATSVRLAMTLSGQALQVGGNLLEVGPGREKTLEPYPTLHAHLVESAHDEAVFLEDVEKTLRELDIACKLICGKHQKLDGRQALSGYSLVVHDLKPHGSLRLQQVGLGGYRRFGCGIFIPHKTISGLD